MKKNIISVLSVGLALLLVFSPFTSSKVNASELRKCDMTITSDNTWGNFARPSGDCKEFFKGHYVPEAKQFVVTGSWTGEVTNGQKIRTHLPIGSEYPEYELTVSTVVKEQPKPKPEPETPKPEPKPEPKEPEKEKPKETKPQPKPEKPKQDGNKESSSGGNNSNKNNSGGNNSNKNSSGGNSSGSNGSNNSGTSNSGSSSSGSKSTSSSNAGNSNNNSSNNNSNENVVEGDKELPDAEKEWTIEEMREKNVEVIVEDGRYFVEIDGVKREITEDQAKELGFEEKNEEKEKVEEEKAEDEVKEDNTEEVTEEESSENQSDDNGNAVKTTVIAIGTTGALAGTIGGIYYFHPSGREAIEKILKKILDLFKLGK